jgi:hypothetical protein
VFENRALRRIFGPKLDEVKGSREGPNVSSNIVQVTKSRKMRWAWQEACMRERRGSYRTLVGISEERRQLGRPRRRWDGNIKIYLQEVGWEH